MQRYIYLFITALAVGLLSLLGYLGVFQSDTTRRLETIDHVLKAPHQQGLTMNMIKNRVFDIQSKEGTRGRAFYLGQKMFLTAYHVIDNLKVGFLVRQDKRGPIGGDHHTFKVLHFKPEWDLALLEAEKFKSEDDLAVTLAKATPALKSDVSLFMNLSKGNKEHAEYRVEFGGEDVYEKGKYIDFLGRLVLPENSSIYEKQGLVLQYDVDKLKLREGKFRDNDAWKKIKTENDLQYLTSITGYQGESGSAVFTRNENLYQLAGILFAVIMTEEVIPTPGHPMDFYAHDRTVSIIIRPETIQKFLTEYAKRLQNA